MTMTLSRALFREVRPEFFRVLAGPAARLYMDALDSLERVAMEHVQGMDRDGAIGLIEEAVEAHADVVLDETVPVGSTTREKARAVLMVFVRAGWVEEEERADWKKLVHFTPEASAMVQTLRKLAFPEAAVFSDKLVSVCTTLTQRDPVNDPLLEEPWQHVESCAANLRDGINELRTMQSAIERHTRRQLAAASLRENLAVLFDQFAERIGRACYAELVHARLPLRLSEARRRVELMEFDADLLGKMQAELLRREPSLAPETAISRVRLRIEELSDLLESVVPVADSVDRRTAEFTRRSLARFRYLQETTSENRGRIQDFFETLNQHFAGRRVADLDEEEIEFPSLRIHETRLLAGIESLYTPRLRRAAGEIAPLDDEATDDQQDDALRRLHSAMRDSMTVARANRFADQVLNEKTSIASEEIPIRCEEDLADLIACLLHASASDARYRLDLPRRHAETDRPDYDPKLSYRIERFTLSRK